MADPEFAWTQDSWDEAVDARDRRISSRDQRLAWFIVLTLAAVALELTADPALSTSVGCLKFGWDEIRLAFWLKRTDPDRTRGRICSRFYLAWGIWRISLVATATAFLLAFAFLALEEYLGKPRGAGGPPPGFDGALLLALAGFLTSSAVSSLAMLSALRHRVRVWVGPEVRWARKEGVWPPQSARRRGETSNRANYILISALIAIIVPALTFLLAGLSRGVPRGVMSPETTGAIMGISLIAMPVMALLLLARLGERMIAATPESCWTEVEESK